MESLRQRHNVSARPFSSEPSEVAIRYVAPELTLRKFISAGMNRQCAGRILDGGTNVNDEDQTECRY